MPDTFISGDEAVPAWHQSWVANFNSKECPVNDDEVGVMSCGGDCGKVIGVTYSGDESEVIKKLRELEERDKRYVSSSGANRGVLSR